MTEPTDAEKILLKTLKVQTEQMDKTLSTFLYQLDSGELCAQQYDAYMEKIKASNAKLNAMTLSNREEGIAEDAFYAAWDACWQALCTLAETQDRKP